METRYEIYEDVFEFRFGKYKDSIPEMSASEVEQMYFEQTSHEPFLVRSFDNAADAVQYFRENFSQHADTRAVKENVFWLLYGHIAYLEENQYDDDGWFDQGGAIWGTAVAGYEKEKD